MENQNPLHLTSKEIKEIRRSYHPLLYTKDEEDAVKHHIETYFGPWTYEMEEVISPDIKVNILAIPPDDQRVYWTMVTVGMGAYTMEVPKEYRHEDQPKRCEIMLFLPASWDVLSNRPEWYWPLYVLKRLARYPVEHHTWLEAGHLLEDPKPYAEGVPFRTTILYPPWTVRSKARRLILPGGDELAFYQAVPIYDDEMKYRDDAGAEAFYKLMKAELPIPVIHADRPHMIRK